MCDQLITDQTSWISYHLAWVSWYYEQWVVLTYPVMLLKDLFLEFKLIKLWCGWVESLSFRKNNHWHLLLLSLFEIAWDTLKKGTTPWVGLATELMHAPSHHERINRAPGVHNVGRISVDGHVRLCPPKFSLTATLPWWFHG